MSSDSPSQLRPRFAVTPTMKIVVLAWLVLVIGGGFLFSINNSNTAVVRDNENKTSKSPADLPGNVDSGSPELSAELEAAYEEVRRLTEQINRQKPGVGGAPGINEPTRFAKSEQAVQKANLVALTAEVNSVAAYLSKLKKLQTDWAAFEATLLNGEAGRRISGSPKHLQLVVDLWQRERPSAERIGQWESELTVLSEPISQPSADQATIAITEEHSKRLSDLGQELKKQATEFERQKLLLESIQRETSALKPATVPLVDAMEQHRGQQEKAEADRLAQVRETARSQAEKETAERIAKSEHERAEAVAKLKEQEIEADKQRLAEKTKQVEEDRKWAKLEAEMDRDMNEIKGLLLAYTAPGFTHRPDKKKGPVSYTLIKSAGGLEPTREGLDKLFYMGRGDTDRPRGGLPVGVGGILGSGTPSAPIERAQELLVKYGELMVRKEMLAP